MVKQKQGEKKEENVGIRGTDREIEREVGWGERDILTNTGERKNKKKCKVVQEGILCIMLEILSPIDFIVIHSDAFVCALMHVV